MKGNQPVSLHLKIQNWQLFINTKQPSLKACAAFQFCIPRIFSGTNRRRKQLNHHDIKYRSTNCFPSHHINLSENLWYYGQMEIFLFLLFLFLTTFLSHFGKLLIQNRSPVFILIIPTLSQETLYPNWHKKPACGNFQGERSHSIF